MCTYNTHVCVHITHTHTQRERERERERARHTDKSHLSLHTHTNLTFLYDLMVRRHSFKVIIEGYVHMLSHAREPPRGQRAIASVAVVQWYKSSLELNTRQRAIVSVAVRERESE